jgi:hypothetical protein
MPRPVSAALALLALALSPAAAQAAHQHDLQFDKQEIFSEVPSGGAVTIARASCNSGYRVLQGSIRVDTVPGGRLADVRVRTSAPENDSTWFYELVNTTRAGQQAAQIKLMISCVKPTTSGGSGGQHSIAFNDRFDSALPVAAGREFGSGTSLECSGLAPFESPGSIPAGAGWVFDPDSGYRQLIGLQPTVAQASGGAGGYFLGDNWDFTLGGNTSQVAYTLYANVQCLKHLTGVAFGENSNHQHYLDATVQIVNRQIGQTQGASGYYSQGISCPSSYYAVAPTWNITGASNSRGLRLVGIGYQGDQDVFRFVNPNGDAGFVSFGVICVGTKTSFSNSASPGAGPGPQKLLMSEKSRAATVAPGKTLTTTLGCAGKTDIVTAGGIGGADAADLRVVRSGGGAKQTKWPFVLRNAGGGAAHVKLYVKCLSPWAEGHTLVVDGVPSAAPDGMADCQPGQISIRPSTEGSLSESPVYRCLERTTTQRINHYHRLNTKTINSVVGGGASKTLSCAATYDAIAPQVDAAKGARLVRSVPDGRHWTFGFAGSGKSTVTVTCLKTGTTPEVARPVTQPLEQEPS